MLRPFISTVIQGLPSFVPFVGPEALERVWGRPFKARLGANESLFGPSPKAIAAMERAAAENWMYSDPENHDLRWALASFYTLTPDNVVVGEGIDGLLGLAVAVASDPGSTIVTTDGAYPTFNFHVAAHGGRLVKVPMRDDHEDLPRLLDTARREKARILYVSNPNSPMGSWWSAAEVQALIADLPDGLLLILDEAYCDTAPGGDVLAAIDTSNPQVLRFRTFSKAYGLAGARIGYCLGESSLIALFEKVRNHYGVNRVGQIGALAALEDQAYLAETVARITAGRDAISRIAQRCGFKPLASATNFVAIDCGRDGVYAKRILDEVLAREVFIRRPIVAPLDRCIRVSCGRKEDIAIFEAALAGAIEAAGR